MKPLLITATAAFFLTACSAATSDIEGEAAATDAATPSVLISDGYILAPLKGRDIASGYFVAENQGPAISLISASSPLARATELHTHSEVDGMMNMRKVDAVDLPENGSVAFEPGSFHLMMFGFTQVEGQTDAPVTLTLSTGEELVVSLPIRARN